jgi:hypothetical protein
MGWSSLAGIAQSLEDGKRWQTSFYKVTESLGRVGGRFYDGSPSTGWPDANTWAGTPLAFVDTNASSGFGFDHGPPVAPATKHLSRFEVVARGNIGQAPVTWTLLDMQGYWPGISATTNSLQTLTGTPTLRYANGAGVQMYVVITTSTGSTAPTTAVSYTNQDGISGQALSSNPVGLASSAPPHIYNGPLLGGGGNRFPFLPLAAGDYGVQNVASFQLSAAHSAGVLALVLARPIATLCSPALISWMRRDYVMGMSLLPRIHEDACLTMLTGPYGGNTVSLLDMVGHLEFVWGG